MLTPSRRDVAVQVINMENAALEIIDKPIPGVKPAAQKRSRILQDKFVAAGRTLLLETRLEDISIPVLAEKAGSSVGGFYSRFESKEAFFEFLRVQMLAEHMKLHEEKLSEKRFEGKTHREISEAFVGGMLNVFSGPWRGVLREAYALIPDRPENWVPMNARGQVLRARITELYRGRLEQTDGLEERVSIAVQLLFSALNNELMNPNLAFRINDPKFRFYLVASFDSLVSGRATQVEGTPT